MRPLVTLIIVLSGIVWLLGNSATLTATAQPLSPQSAVPSDEGAVFGPGASRGGPPTLIPADGAETWTAQTGALGSLIQTTIIQHGSLSHAAVEEALQVDINVSLRAAPGCFAAWSIERSTRATSRSLTTYSARLSKRVVPLYSDGGSGSGLPSPPPPNH